MQFCLDNLICYNCDQITQMQHFKVQLLCLFNMSVHSTGLLPIVLGLASCLKWWVACGYLWGTGWRFDTPGLGDEHPKLVQNPGPLAPHHILSHFWKNSRYLILPFIIRTVHDSRNGALCIPFSSQKASGQDKWVTEEDGGDRTRKGKWQSAHFMLLSRNVHLHQRINNFTITTTFLQISPVSFSKCSCLTHHSIPQQVHLFHCKTLQDNLLMFYGKMGYKFWKD